MPLRAPSVPRKLSDDSIVEALCELRFVSSDLSEIVIGRLADAQPWSNYTKQRMPSSHIPAELRKVDPNLKYAPILTLKSADPGRLVRIGESILSLHVAPNYCGWSVWRPELSQAIDVLFSKLTNIQVTRIGFRYINAFTAERHKVSGVGSLELIVTAAGVSVENDVNLNFREQIDPQTVVLTRVATPSFVQGVLPRDASVVVDIDVYTPEGYSSAARDEVVSWIDSAHEVEKNSFFSLIPHEILSQLMLE